MKMKEIKWNAKLVFSIAVMVVGILYYLLWNIKYGAWTDIGIYSATILFVSLGILGSLYSLAEAK